MLMKSLSPDNVLFKKGICICKPFLEDQKVIHGSICEDTFFYSASRRVAQPRLEFWRFLDERSLWPKFWNF